MGDAGQGFCVVDDRGTSPQSDNRRERRTDTGNSAFPLERFHQSGFFADLVCASAAVPVDVEIVAVIGRFRSISTAKTQSLRRGLQV